MAHFKNTQKWHDKKAKEFKKLTNAELEQVYIEQKKKLKGLTIEIFTNGQFNYADNLKAFNNGKLAEYQETLATVRLLIVLVNNNRDKNNRLKRV